MCRQKKKNKDLFEYKFMDINYIFCSRCGKIINDSIEDSICKVKQKYNLGN